MFHFSKFSLKMNFSGKKNVDIFEKWIHFLILCIVLKNETSLPSGGGLCPRTPCGGRVIAIMWPGRPPPRKNFLAKPLLTPKRLGLFHRRASLEFHQLERRLHSPSRFSAVIQNTCMHRYVRRKVSGRD